jgi:hypothetical protein
MHEKEGTRIYEGRDTKEGDGKMIKYTCEYPGCGFAREDLESDEHLNLS